MHLNAVIVLFSATCLLAALGIHLKPKDGPRATDVNLVRDQDPKREDRARWPAMVEVATPGVEHAALLENVGSWTVRSEMMGQRREGSATITGIMGGRFIQIEQEIASATRPIQTCIIIGFDQVTQRYQSVSMTSTETGIVTAEGSAQGKVIALRGQMQDTVAPQERRPFRMVMTQISGDAFRIDVYDSVPLAMASVDNPAGREFLVMTEVFTRKP
ncbi:MAG: DUF1579 family protein [Planctomycetes bacterium]|nr:DUF1579 family protein [Planctomycetota bacterium]